MTISQGCATWLRNVFPAAKRGFWGAGFLFLGAVHALHAADAGQFQLLLAAPDPVLAGETVRFQVIAVNKGTEVWRARKYVLLAEVYDEQKNYIGRAERFRGENDVNPGESLVAHVPFKLPMNFSGRYYYRVFLENRDQRVIESEYKFFTVRERPVLPPRPPSVALGGNMIVSYRNATGPEPYVGNISLNLIGRAQERSFLFNAYTFHDAKDPIDFYTVLLNYYGPHTTVGIGDVSPNMSSLSVYGQGMRGGLVEDRQKMGKVEVETTLAAGRTVTSQEGTSSTDGIFRRMLYGGKIAVETPGRVTFFGNYVNSYDVEDSLEQTGPTLTPVDDKVFGGGAEWEFLPRMKWGAEYQTSRFLANKTSTHSAVNDNAWRTFLSAEREKFTFNGSMQRTGANFYSLGAPNATRDRLTYDAGLSLTPRPWFSFYGIFNQYRDNLKNDPSRVTSQQQITSGGVNFRLPTQTGLNLGYSNNTAVGTPRTAQDNETVTLSAGLSQTLKGQTIAVGYQAADFVDKTQTTNDLKTNSVNGSLSLSFGPRVSSSWGGTVSASDDQIDGSQQEAQSFSGSINAELKKGKLYAQLWGALTATEDNDLVNKVERETTNFNLEFTYQLKTNCAVTVGAFHNDTQDAVTPANDLTSNGGNMRVSYSF